MVNDRRRRLARKTPHQQDWNQDRNRDQHPDQHPDQSPNQSPGRTPSRKPKQRTRRKSPWETRSELAGSSEPLSSRTGELKSSRRTNMPQSTAMCPESSTRAFEIPQRLTRTPRRPGRRSPRRRCLVRFPSSRFDFVWIHEAKFRSISDGGIGSVRRFTFHLIKQGKRAGAGRVDTRYETIPLEGS